MLITQKWNTDSLSVFYSNSVKSRGAWRSFEATISVTAKRSGMRWKSLFNGVRHKGPITKRPSRKIRFKSRIVNRQLLSWKCWLCGEWAQLCGPTYWAKLAVKAKRDIRFSRGNARLRELRRKLAEALKELELSRAALIPQTLEQ